MVKFFIFPILSIILSCSTPQKNEFEDLDGNPVYIEDFEGDNIIMHFWATTCRPCLVELPALQRIKDSLKNENYSILLASDQSTDVIKKYKKDSGLDFTFLKFTGQLHQKNIYVLPTTIIYNTEGEKVVEETGVVEWDSPKAVRNLLQNVQ